jgi:hypothetical protein
MVVLALKNYRVTAKLSGVDTVIILQRKRGCLWRSICRTEDLPAALWACCKLQWPGVGNA